MNLKGNIFHTLIYQLPIILVNFFVGIVSTRLLGSEMKGMNTILQANINLSLLILSFGISSSLIQYISLGKVHIRYGLPLGVLLTVISSILLSSLMLCIIYFDASDWVIPFLKEDSFFFFYIISSFIVLNMNNVFVAILSASHHFKLLNKINLHVAILNLIILGTYWLLVVKTDIVFDFKFFLIITLIANLSFTTSYLLVYFKENIQINIWINMRKALVILREIYKFNLQTYAISILMFLNYRLDLWVIQYYMPYKELGAYALAAGLAQLLWIISNSISSVLLPYLNNKEVSDKEKQRYLKIFVRMAFSLSVLLGSIGAVLGYFAIPFIYGEEFRLSKEPFIYLVLGIVLSNYYRIFSRYCVSIGKIYLNLYVIAIACILTVVFDILLIPAYGIVGAAIATSLVYAFMFMTYNLLFFVKLKIPFDNYFFLSKSDLFFLLNRN